MIDKKFRTMDDIERDKDKERKKKIVTDVDEIFKGLFPQRKPKPKKKRWTLIKFLGFFFLLLFMVNLILGNIWLLKFFITDLFAG